MVQRTMENNSGVKKWVNDGERPTISNMFFEGNSLKREYLSKDQE